MPMSKEMQEAQEVANQLDERLTSYDLIYTAIVYHDDGSFHVLRNAIVYKWHDYFMIFGEHHQPQVLHKDDGSVLQLLETASDEIKGSQLPFPRQLLIDDLPFTEYSFARKPKVDDIFWIIDPTHKHRGRTIKITSADAFTVRATEDFPRHNLWEPGEKEAWEAKQAANKADPEWETYQRLVKKFEED